VLLLPETLTLSEAHDTLRLLETALKRETESLLQIDAGPLKRFDSSALAVLLECRRLATAWGKRFEVRGLPPQLGDLARLYGIDTLLNDASAAAPPDASAAPAPQPG
jgi:phospholipid transport system transporter-binding protein